MNITTKLFSAAVAASCCFGLTWTGDCIAAGQPAKEPAVKGTRLSWAGTLPFSQTAINTEILPESRGRIEVKFAYYGVAGNYGCIFDARKSSSVQSYSLFASPLDGNTWTFSYFRYNDKINEVPSSNKYKVGEPVIVSISADEGIAVNGETIPGTAVGAADFTVGGKLRLFSSGSPGSESGTPANGAVMKFYWMKVYRADNSLQASFVPYQDEDGVVGVLEECEGRFHKVSSGKLYCGRVLTAEPIKRGRAHVCVSGISLDPNDQVAGHSRRYFHETDLCLWTACDSTDKGENLADWQYRRFCGYIPFEGWEGEVMPPDEFLQSDFKGVARVFIAGAPYGLVGDGNSCIELDDGIGSSNRVEILLKSTDSTQQSGVFGARNGASDHNFSTLLNNGSLCIDFTLNDYNASRGGGGLQGNSFGYICSDKSIRSVESLGWAGLDASPSRSEDTRPYNTSFQPAANCRVFGMYGAPAGFGCFKGAIYSFRVFNTESGELSHDLVATVNEQEEPCMYDLVSGKFYENKGTGSFQILDANTTTSYSIPLKHPKGITIFFM